MRALHLLIGLLACTAGLMAQPDTLVAPVPPVPPMPPAAPVPPVPPAPPATSITTVVEQLESGQRIVVTEGDTTVIITTDKDGRTVTKVIVGEFMTDSVPGQGPTRLHMGIDAHDGAYMKVENGDTTKNDPVIITMRRKVIKIISEDREVPSDSARMAERLKELRTERRNLFTYWSGLDLGLNTLLGPDGSSDLDKDAEFMEIDNSRSRFFAINFMEQKIEFGSPNVGLLTGLGWEFVNYHLKNNVQLQYNADSVYGVTLDSPEYSKNKLRQIGFRVPVMIEFNTKRAPLPSVDELRSKKGFSYDRKRNFHLAVGVIGSWYYENMYKQKYRQDGSDHKDRYIGDYQLMPVRAALSARVGYGGLNLFAEYALTPLFKDGKGPELTPLNVGLTLVGFN